MPWRHSQISAWHPSLFMTGGSPPSKMQLHGVLLSALYIRGRCLEHLPKGCSWSRPWTVLSWAGNFHQNSPAAQPRRKTFESNRSTSAWLQPSSRAACTGRSTACWFLLPQLFVPFTLNMPRRKRQKDFIASNFKYFCIYLHYWCFGLQTLKSSPRQEEFCTKLLLSLWIKCITWSKIWAWVYRERFLIAWQPANSPFSSNCQRMGKWGL